jgi:hypothetical protein
LVSNDVADVANADPADIGLLLFGRFRDRAPSKDPDGFPLDLLSQSRMQAVARRQVDASVEALL